MRSASSRLIPFTCMSSSIPARLTPAKPPNWRNSAALRLAPTPATSSRVEASRAFSRRPRWPVMAKRCASSRTDWIRCEAGDSRPRPQAAAGIAENQAFVPGLARLPLGNTNHLHAFDAQGRQHIERLAYLAEPTIDQQDVGQPALAGLDAPVAPLQRLMHGRVVVAARDSLILKRRYCDFSGPSGPNTTQEATVASPIV